MDSTTGSRTAKSAATFAEFIERERERLKGERAKVNEQIAVLNEQGSALDRELVAIDAYEQAKSGKPARANGRGRSTGSARKGSKRDAILAVVKENPGGMSRGDILTKMGLKGDKAGEMSVSNALTALVKGGHVDRQNKKYVPVAAA